MVGMVPNVELIGARFHLMVLVELDTEMDSKASKVRRMSFYKTRRDNMCENKWRFKVGIRRHVNIGLF